MININIDEMTDRISKYPEQIQRMLIAPEKNFTILSIFDNNNIKDEDVIYSISNGIKMVATKFMSKEGLYELVNFKLGGNEDVSKKLFFEIDTKILRPNLFTGLEEKEDEVKNDLEAPESLSTSKEDSGDEGDYTDEELAFLSSIDKETAEKTAVDTKDEDKYSTENITETAEDILREIENPTSSPRILPQTAPTQTIVPAPDTLPSTIVSKPETETAPSLKTQSAQAAPQTPATTTTKESQLDSKLTETVIQPSKSTYYKVDPYREQA